MVGFSCRPETLSYSLFSSPWQPPAPAASAYPEVASKVNPLSAAAPPGPPYAPLTSNYPDVAVSASTKFPYPLCLGLLLRRGLLRLLSAPLGAFVCALFRAFTAHAVLPPLHCCLVCSPADPQSFFSSCSPPLSSSLLPHFPPALPPPCRASFSFCPWIYPLPPYPHLRRT